ncbi:hypothetical protein [Dietzia sp. NCCP-2495]|nr:hypothetical protein [Dietzia sp. NCCP-2495]
MTDHAVPTPGAPDPNPSRSRRVRAQPMLVISDVPASSRWY